MTERELIDRRQIREILKIKRQRRKFYALHPRPDAIRPVTGAYLYYLDQVRKIMEGDQDTLL